MSIILLRFLPRLGNVDQTPQGFLIDADDPAVAAGTVGSVSVLSILDKLIRQKAIISYASTDPELRMQITSLAHCARQPGRLKLIELLSFHRSWNGWAYHSYEENLPALPYTEGDFKISDEVRSAMKSKTFCVRSILLADEQDYILVATPPVSSRSVSVEVIHRDGPSLSFVIDKPSNDEIRKLSQLSGNLLYKKDYVKLLQRLDYEPQVKKVARIMVKRVQKYKPRGRRARGVTIDMAALKMAKELTYHRHMNEKTDGWYYGGPEECMRKVQTGSSVVHITMIY